MATLNEDSAMLSLEDAKLLATLCQQGKLYKVEEWIASGESSSFHRNARPHRSRSRSTADSTVSSNYSRDTIVAKKRKTIL